MDILSVCESISRVLCCFIDIYDSPDLSPNACWGYQPPPQRWRPFLCTFEVLATAWGYGNLHLGERFYWVCVPSGVWLKAECADWILLAGGRLNAILLDCCVRVCAASLVGWPNPKSGVTGQGTGPGS
jgi:hypothetical protein